MGAELSFYDKELKFSPDVHEMIHDMVQQSNFQNNKFLTFFRKIKQKIP
jgi:hypothetical protein